jgi:hypothetical protein
MSRLYVAQRIRDGLSGVLVVGRVAAKPQAQLASEPEGSVKLGPVKRRHPTCLSTS